MSFLKIDDNVPHHQKHLKAGPAASWLWLCGVAYCQRHFTDGFIPAVALPTLGVPDWRRWLPILIEVGLWEKDGNDYRIHDFLGHNDSAETRRQKSAERNARVTRHRERKRNALPIGISNAPPTPTPTPTPTTSTTSGVTSTSGPRPFDRQHAGHVFGFCAFKCLSEEKIQQFAKDLPRGINDPENFNRVVQWAEHVRDTWGERAMRESKWWEFWEARWSERLSGMAPTTSATPSEHPLMAEAEARRRSIREGR